MGFWIMLIAIFLCFYLPYKLFSKLIDKWKK